MSVKTKLLSQLDFGMFLVCLIRERARLRARTRNLEHASEVGLILKFNRARARKRARSRFEVTYTGRILKS